MFVTLCETGEVVLGRLSVGEDGGDERGDGNRGEAASVTTDFESVSGRRRDEGIGCDSPLRKRLCQRGDLPREDSELSGDVHSGKVVSRVGFRVSKGLCSVDNGREGGFVGINGNGGGVVVEDVRDCRREEGGKEETKSV